MFTHVQLVASPKHSQNVPKTDLSLIAPYVKSVLFVALPNGWTLTLDGFKETLTAGAIREYTEEHDIWCGVGSWAYEDNAHEAFIKEHWEGNLPFSDDEVRAGFERHQGDALASKEMLSGAESTAA